MRALEEHHSHAMKDLALAKARQLQAACAATHVAVPRLEDMMVSEHPGQVRAREYVHVCVCVKCLKNPLWCVHVAVPRLEDMMASEHPGQVRACVWHCVWRTHSVCAHVRVRVCTCVGLGHWTWACGGGLRVGACEARAPMQLHSRA